MSAEEVEGIQRRKMLELQRRIAEEQRRSHVQEQVEVQKQALLRKILAPDARQRLNNLKMVKPEFAEQLELQLIQLAQVGKINIPVMDEELRELLIRLQSQRREIKIRRA